MVCAANHLSRAPQIKCPLTQINIESRVAALSLQRKLATDELERARCGILEAKAADLVDDLRTAALDIAIAAFAAVCAKRTGVMQFSQFLIQALNPDGTLPPNLEQHQARIAKQLGIPA
jgi:hypothetical protein